MTHRRHFPAVPASVAQARRFALDHLPETAADVRERVELMVSELAANCVVHAATAFDVVVSPSRDRVQVEVTDGGSGEPGVRWPDPLEPKGRGLQIVSTLADRWGVRPSDDGTPGKTVWFELRLSPAPAPTGGASS